MEHLISASVEITVETSKMDHKCKITTKEDESTTEFIERVVEALKVWMEVE